MLRKIQEVSDEVLVFEADGRSIVRAGRGTDACHGLGKAPRASSSVSPPPAMAPLPVHKSSAFTSRFVMPERGLFAKDRGIARGLCVLREKKKVDCIQC